MTTCYCHRCNRDTPTTHFELSNGDVANACATCRTCRKGRPYITRAEYRDWLHNRNPLTPNRPKVEHEHATTR